MTGARTRRDALGKAATRQISSVRKIYYTFAPQCPSVSAVKLNIKNCLVRHLSGIPSVSALIALLISVFCAGAGPTSPSSAPAVASTDQVTALAALKARVTDAHEDIYRWLREMPALDENPEEEPNHMLSLRIDHRFKIVSEAIAEFRRKHPDAAVIEGIEAPFREEMVRLLEMVRQLEMTRHEQPDSAEPWSELAHQLLHTGRVVEAFECFEKSLALLPLEASYYADFGTSLLIYRQDAAAHYKLTEQAVFDKALRMYRRGMNLEPENFRYAVALAEIYYLITPARLVDGQTAWEHALNLAGNESERNEVMVHLARYAINRGHPNLAKVYLEQVKEPRWTVPKLALLRRITDSEKNPAPTSVAP